jgi:hypothetical protein
MNTANGGSPRNAGSAPGAMTSSSLAAPPAKILSRSLQMWG